MFTLNGQYLETALWLLISRRGNLATHLSAVKPLNIEALHVVSVYLHSWLFYKWNKDL